MYLYFVELEEGDSNVVWIMLFFGCFFVFSFEEEDGEVVVY